MDKNVLKCQNLYHKISRFSLPSLKTPDLNLVIFWFKRNENLLLDSGTSLNYNRNKNRNSFGTSFHTPLPVEE